MDEMTHPPRICKTCNVALDTAMTIDGVGYQHPARMGTVDHEVVPVEPTEDWRGACDFCRTGTAAWVLPVRDFAPSELPQHTSTGGWAACGECARLIEKDQWNALVRRVVSDFPEYYGVPEMQTQLKCLYR